MKPFLNSKELAILLGVTENKLAVWRMRGGGPHFVKFSSGSRSGVRYRQQDVDSWVEERIKNSTKGAKR